MTPLIVVGSVAAALAIFALLVRAMRMIDAEHDLGWRGFVDVPQGYAAPPSPVVTRPVPTTDRPMSAVPPPIRRCTGIYAIDPLPGTPLASLADHVAAARSRGVTQIAMPVAVFEQMCAIVQRATDDESKERIP